MTPDHARLMARYNIWQNESLYSEANALTDDQRRADMGLFFSSIHETLNHILWADRLWLSRFSDAVPPRGKTFDEARREVDEWGALETARRNTDRDLKDWADTLSPDDLTGELTWYSGAMGREVSKPKGLLVAHLFNHQTHHRGQVHAALTRLGRKPTDTDIPFMPPEYF